MFVLTGGSQSFVEWTFPASLCLLFCVQRAITI